MFSHQTVFYTKDFKLEMLNCDEEKILKCGEIFRHSNGNLSMTCDHCDLLKFSSFSDYALHVDKHYNLLLQEPLQSIAKDNNIVVEFISDIRPESEAILYATSEEEDMQLIMEETNRSKRKLQTLIPKTRSLEKSFQPPRQSFVKVEHSCDYCDEKLRTKQMLVDHMMDVHKKGHGCEYCGKHFKSIHTLTEHIRSHTGEKPFACTFCPSHFTTSSSLQTHIMKHKGDKKYLCAECGQGFVLRSQHTRHVRLQHSDEAVLLRERYPCTLCDRKYMMITNLRDHMLSHLNKKTVMCEICSKTFTTRKHIVQHMQLHSGIKPYVCRYCPAAFAQASGRRNHEKYNHENKEIF